MFGHEADPTRIYRYGARLPRAGLAVIEDQLRRVHAYRNALVRLEHQRRAGIRAVLQRAMPTGVAWEQTVALLDALLTEHRDVLARSHAQRRRREISAQQKAAAQALKAAKREAFARLKAMRQATTGRADVQAALAAVNAQAVAEGKRLRATSGLYWGSYLAVEQAMQATKSGPPPRLHRWDGTGKLAVQLQQGLSRDALHAATDRRLQLPAPEGRSPYTVCRFRLGSIGREPLWAEIPVKWHRPLPEGAEVKWAYLQVRRVATSRIWELSLVVSCPEGFPPRPCAEGGTVGIDPGWRLRPHGLRVAYWVGSDGRQGELVIPKATLEAWDWLDELATLRRRRFQAVLAELCAWVEANGRPDWWPEDTATLAQWRSYARLAALSRLWQTAHADEFRAMGQRLEAWRRLDLRRYQEQEHLRRKLIDGRDTRYRTFVAELRRRYHTAVVEDTDWRQIARRPLPEEAAVLPDAVQRYRQIAAPGRLCQLIREGMPECLEAPAAHSTQRCSICGHLMRVDTTALQVVCPHHAGTMDMDQDWNAAKNFLLAAPALRARATR